MKAIKNMYHLATYMAALGIVNLICLFMSIPEIWKGKRQKGKPMGEPNLKNGNIKTTHPIDPPLNEQEWFRQLVNKRFEQF